MTIAKTQPISNERTTHMKNTVSKIATAALIAASMTAALPVGAYAAETTTSASKTDTVKDKTKKTETIKLGKVTAVKDKSITVSVVDMPTRPAGKPSDKTKSDSTKSDSTKTDKTAPEGMPQGMPPFGGKDGKLPEGMPASDGKNDKDGKGGAGAMFSFDEKNAKSVTIKTDGVTITKDGKAAKVSDIKKDDIITLVYDGDTLKEIRIGADMPGGHGKPGKFGKDKTKTDETTKTDKTETTKSSS